MHLKNVQHVLGKCSKCIKKLTSVLENVHIALKNWQCVFLKVQCVLKNYFVASWKIVLRSSTQYLLNACWVVDKIELCQFVNNWVL